MNQATKEDEVLIDVARDFSETPGGRYISEGEWSGELFRSKLLEPPLRAGKTVAVDLDSASGFTTSFLEEAFGGLVRLFGPEVAKRIRITADAKPHRLRKALEYVQRAVDAY